jgi:hypothetical protein
MRSRLFLGLSYGEWFFVNEIADYYKSEINVKAWGERMLIS